LISTRNPNATRTVNVRVDDKASTVCRLCHCRSKADEVLVILELYPGPRLEIYCHECYAYLWERALSHIPGLPSIDKLTVEPSPVSIPEYLIKDNMSLALHYPKDNIDLGRLRARRRRNRNREDT